METVKVTEETRETVKNLSEQSGIKMYKIFEQAVALWKAKHIAKPKKTTVRNSNGKNV